MKISSTPVASLSLPLRGTVAFLCCLFMVVGLATATLSGCNAGQIRGNFSDESGDSGTATPVTATVPIENNATVSGGVWTTEIVFDNAVPTDVQDRLISILDENGNSIAIDATWSEDLKTVRLQAVLSYARNYELRISAFTNFAERTISFHTGSNPNSISSDERGTILYSTRFNEAHAATALLQCSSTTQTLADFENLWTWTPPDGESVRQPENLLDGDGFVFSTFIDDDWRMYYFEDVNDTSAVQLYSSANSGIIAAHVAYSGAVSSPLKLIFFQASPDPDGDLESEIYGVQPSSLKGLVRSADVATAPLKYMQFKIRKPTFSRAWFESGDFNADGYYDVALTTYDSTLDEDVVRIYNNYSGTEYTTLRVPSDTSPTYISSGDFNGDSYTDLLVTSAPLEGPTPAMMAIMFGPIPRASRLSLAEVADIVVFGSGGDGFARPTRWAMGFDRTIFVTDINADGISDIIASTTNDLGYVYIKYGSSSISSRNAFGLSQFFDAVYTEGGNGDKFGTSLTTLGDLNGDGITDWGAMDRNSLEETEGWYLFSGSTTPVGGLHISTEACTYLDLT